MESGMLEVLTEEVIEHEHEVHDVPQGAAEELYISLCQQLDGYGQETFSARNEENVEVMLGISVSGVIVGNGGSHKFYPWREIVNVVNHKRTFSIECTDPSQNVSFTLPDAEFGRYIWKLCVSQHTFFMNYEQNHHTSQANLNLFQNVPEHFNESREDLLSSGDKIYFSNSQLAIPNSTTNLTVWHPSSESLLNTNPMESRTSLQASVVDLPNPTAVQTPQWNPAGSTENTSTINRTQSSSCVDLTNNNNNNNNNNSNAQQTNLNSSMNVSKERFLPKYRPAPSYEVAIQQKFRGSQTDLPLQQQLQSHHLTFDNYGHPSNAPMGNLHAAQVHYPDVTHVTPHKNYFDASDYLSQRLKMLSLNPPQYPANRLSSTSTPDLALASHRGLFGYRQNNISSPDLVSSRTLIHPHAYIPPYAHSILYPYGGGGGTVIAGNNNKHQKLRHSNSFLPHATYENLNFIETTNPNFFPAKHIPNNLIYRTASSAAAQQLADMEYYLNKQQQKQQQHRNHSLNALNLSNSHISEPIYENVPLPLVKSSNALHTTTTNEKTHHPVLIKPSPRIAQTAVRTNSAEESSSDANFYNINKGSSRNISNSDPLNGNENENNNNRMSQQKQQHYLLMNNDNNGNSILSGSTSITNINVSTSHDAHNKISVVVPAAAASTISSSPFHIENNLQEKQRFSKNHANASTTLPMMNISGASSNYTMNTTNTTTADTTDSGISTDGAGKKRNKFWNLLGKNKSSSSSKQKSATLGREKEGKNKKDKSGDATNKEAESNMRHRWSTGLPRLQPLPANVSKEKLCQMLDAKLNDTQLFLEFERIPKRKENAQYTSALLEENQNKNVDSTCLPMDENRVKLIPTRENRIGYVNASHVSVSSN
jgi:tyrosine-protein phosphatase non-receptor type 14/21